MTTTENTEENIMIQQKHQDVYDVKTSYIKEFFTLSEWDLIVSLVDNNRQFCTNEEEDPVEDYDNIVNKIHKLFEPESIEPS